MPRWPQPRRQPRPHPHGSQTSCEAIPAVRGLPGTVFPLVFSEMTEGVEELVLSRSPSAIGASPSGRPSRLSLCPRNLPGTASRCRGSAQSWVTSSPRSPPRRAPRGRRGCGFELTHRIASSGCDFSKEGTVCQFQARWRQTNQSIKQTTLCESMLTFRMGIRGSVSVRWGDSTSTLFHRFLVVVVFRSLP